jgi:hypothetical protein
MNSLQKIVEFQEEMNGPLPEDPEPLELGVRTVMQLGAPLLAQLLPEDPRELDEQLVRIAAGLLNLRSDDAAPVLISSDDIVEEIGDHRELAAGE